MRLQLILGLSVGLVLLATACDDTPYVACGDAQLCPENFACALTLAGEPACVPAGQCGNGAIDAPFEECDPGIVEPAKGCEVAYCNSQCRINPGCAVCGNGVREGDERCDDGNQVNGDACSQGCTSRCGDGVINDDEACDDGSLAVSPALRRIHALRSNDGCDSACKLETWSWRQERLASSQAPLGPRGDAAFVTVGPWVYVHGGKTNDPFAPYANDTWRVDFAISPPRWEQVSLGAGFVRPPAAQIALMTHRQAGTQGELILYLTQQFGDGEATWKLDLDAPSTGWQQVANAVTPRARQASLITTSANEVQLVSHETLAVWRLVNDAWVPRSATAVGYRKRRDAAGGYRPPMVARPGAVVVQGGRFDDDSDTSQLGTILADTWVLADGANTWQLLPTSLPQRAGHRLVYDDQSDSMYAVGGNRLEVYYLRPDNNWYTQGEASSKMPVREGLVVSTRVTADRGDQKTDFPVFGGMDPTAGVASDEAWEFSAFAGLAWRRLDNSTGVAGSVMLHDANDGLLLFGGERSAASYGSVLQLDTVASAWRKVTSNWGNSRVYLTGDTTPGGVPYFLGGIDQQNDNTFYANLGRYDGGQLQMTDAMQKVAHAAMRFIGDDQAIVFGGTSSDFVNNARPCRADTIQLTLPGTWATLDVGLAPAARCDHAMAYDPVTKRLVLFGGRASVPLFNRVATTLVADAGTWVFEAGAWRQVATPQMPPARYGHVMYYDPKLGNIVMVGGSAHVGTVENTPPYEDVWLFDASALRWSQVVVDAGPGGLRHAAMSYQPAAGRAVLVGGVTHTLAPRNTATWVLQLAGPAPTPEVCSADATADVDGDGEVGCADPDCVGAQGCR